MRYESYHNVPLSCKGNQPSLMRRCNDKMFPSLLNDERQHVFMQKVFLSVGEFENVKCFGKDFSPFFNFLKTEQRLGEERQAAPQDDRVSRMKYPLGHEQSLCRQNVHVHVTALQGPLLRLLWDSDDKAVCLGVKLDSRLEGREKTLTPTMLLKNVNIWLQTNIKTVLERCSLGSLVVMAGCPDVI